MAFLSSTVSNQSLNYINSKHIIARNVKKKTWEITQKTLTTVHLHTSTQSNISIWSDFVTAFFMILILINTIKNGKKVLYLSIKRSTHECTLLIKTVL